jgi:hypothetical protein
MKIGIIEVDTFEKILGVNVAQTFIPLATDILTSRSNPKYTFLTQEDFEQLLGRDKKDANSQYMKEIVYRVHFSAMSSIARNIEWLNGMKFAYEQGLYLPFASSFRSLIESTADSFDALMAVGVTVAENSTVINERLNKKGGSFIIISELEDDLIHYSHARRLEKNEDAPKSHKAKSAAAYVQSLDKKTDSNFYDCYAHLCQLTHPAAEGVLHMMPQIDDYYIFDEKHGTSKIENLVEKYNSSFADLICYAFNPAILALKVINYIDVPPCHSTLINSINLDKLPAWKKCEAHLK